jgi:hypothetical protein
MLVARLICSDPECPETFEARADTLAELEALACDCGCALEIVAWPDVLDASPAPLELVAAGMTADNRTRSLRVARLGARPVRGSLMDAMRSDPSR